MEIERKLQPKEKEDRSMKKTIKEIRAAEIAAKTAAEEAKEIALGAS